MTQLSNDCFAFGGDLLTTTAALELLAERVSPVTEIERVALGEALDRVLAEDLVAEVSVPPHDNSAVDGYAVRFDDLEAEAETRLAVLGRTAAGHPLGRPLESAEAVRIFTGAVMPEGADTVFMQEDVSVDGDHVVLPPGLKRGANRRHAGEDVAAGATVLVRGHRLRPQDVGLAASVGRTELVVHRRLRVAVFSTGDEVREPGEPLPPGAIYDANRYLLMSLMRSLAGSVTDLGILPDEAGEVRAALDEAARDHDLLITSGGVSVGEEDHVKAAVEALGSLYLWRLAIKPGRPIALGQVKAVPFVGLPGNPVAAMVTFLRFARPLILRLGGCTQVDPVLYRVRAEFSHSKKANRREWVRARLETGGDGALVARKFERQGAGILSSLVESDGLVELPEEMTRLRSGTMVDFLPFSEVS
ncbi:MAG: molybdopterin molybdotransferase MoeA [Alphaproteobacteria bacterium]|nr:molybdopterin molybdotransferase MoeA [Alphaproteobacteria bacterium]